MTNTSLERNGRPSAVVAFDPANWDKELERLRRETEDARRQLAARIERDRPFQPLADNGRGRALDMAKLFEASTADYISGQFFLYHVGLILETDPVLAVTVTNLRRAWIRQYDVSTVPEMLLLDQALLAYLHTLRLNKQLADMEAYIDGILFKWDPPTPKLKQACGGALKVDGLEVEDRMRQLQTQSLPVLDRLNVMLVRNLRMLRELKQLPIHVNIQQADQVNVAHQQVAVHDNERPTQEPSAPP